MNQLNHIKMKQKIVLIFLISILIPGAYAQGDDQAKAIVKKAHEITLGETREV